MKVVIDDKIPYIRDAAAQIFDEVVYLPGSEIAPRDVRDADALVVRTRTRCDEALLRGSRVKMVATATIGFEHLDVDYLRQAGIAWSNCPGCNATSVGQYVRNALLVLKRQGSWCPTQSCVGIVGVGHVGRAVMEALQPLGCEFLLNDPPRQEAEGGPFVSLEEVARRCDVVTFHTPLTKSGRHPSYHLADDRFFRLLQRRPILINAARGSVVDTKALLRAMDEDRVSATVIDTWEDEPNISPELLRRCTIGTPHIAGYSADGKSHASQMALEAVCRHFHLPINFHIQPPPLPAELERPLNREQETLLLYNPCADSEALKAHPEDFEFMRGHYPLRRERWDQQPR